jgi:Rieske 2Fe-2S family protein
MNGTVANRKLLGQLTDPDMGSCRLLSLPKSWNHLLADHVFVFRVLALGPQEIAVSTNWLMHKDAVEGFDYDFDRAAKVWATTNEQDRKLTKDNQPGFNSKTSGPGRYPPIPNSGRAISLTGIAMNEP